MRVILIVSMLWAAVCRADGGAAEAKAERSYWVHASLGLYTQRNYWGKDFPATAPPTREEVGSAARLLAGRYGANRLYLIYHKEMPVEEARRVFVWWREACPPGVEVVPALVLRMYDKGGTAVFTEAELRGLVEFFRTKVNAERLAVYDVLSGRDQGAAIGVLARAYPKGLIRLGLQPGETLRAPFVAGVEDTWSGFCHGKENEGDWMRPGFGAETLRTWVAERNAGDRPVTWDLVAVAWDYTAIERGAYPGYDDAEKNMPLPAGRVGLGAELIRGAAKGEVFGGFSSDLYILHENSRSDAHDGRAGSFYETLKAGREYRGYYGGPLGEIARVYRRMGR